MLDIYPSQVPSTIRRVSPDGQVSTLYRPAFGHADGPSGQAKLGRVMALTVTADHGLFVLDNDTVNSYVRRIEADGSIATVATFSQDTRFSNSVKLTTDPLGGNLRLLTNFAVYALSGGKPVLLAGLEQGGEGSVDGPGNLARFTMIMDSISDSTGNIYMIDNFAIRKVTPSGATSTVAGVATSCGGVDGTGSVARFGRPDSLSLDSSGNLLVLDRDNCGGTRSGYQIRQVTSAGVVTTPSYGADPVNVYPPLTATTSRNRLLRVSSDNRIILASTGQLQIQQSTSSAALLAGLEGDSATERDGAGALARFMNPYLLAADLNGNLYVLDSAPAPGGYQLEAGGIHLRKISPDGQVSTIPVSSTLVANGMVSDNDGNLYISVRGPLGTLTGISPGGAILKITPQGSASILAGSQQTGTGTTPVDGNGSTAVFVRPTLLGIDKEGDLYVRDDNYFVTPSVSTIRKVSTQGMVSTVPALPADLGKAPDGYTYSADPARSVVYGSGADGSKTVVAGVLAQRGTRLGTLPGGLDRPQSIVATGPNSFALISGAAILRLVPPQ